MAMVEIARVLKARMGAAARRVPTRQVPDWLVRIVALRDPTVRGILPGARQAQKISGEKARRVLGWSPRSYEESVVDTAQSLIRLGLPKN